MAKSLFSRGACVRAKKWSGQEFFGVLEYTYDDGSHCVLEVATAKKFNVKKDDLTLANEEEEKDIKKLMKENKLKLGNKPDLVMVVKDLIGAQPTPKPKVEDTQDFDILTEGVDEEELPTIEDELD
jgi:hypothetical protein